MYLGRVLGVRVSVHPLFALLLAVAVAGGQGRLAFLLVSLLLTHELAHLLVARAYRLDVSAVEFLPFGGVARIDGLVESEPGVEAAVALAGPLNNFMLLAAGLWLHDAGLIAGEEAIFFIEGNMGLALFNLLPALPLDGGRFWRSVLTPRLGFGRASRLLARLGQAASGTLAAGGTVALAAGYVVPNAFALAAFLFVAASRELSAAGWEALQVMWRKRQRFLARRVLSVQELVALDDTLLREVARYLSPHRYHLIWVVDERMAVLGLVSEPELISALAERGAGATLRDILPRS